MSPLATPLPSQQPSTLQSLLTSTHPNYDSSPSSSQPQLQYKPSSSTAATSSSPLSSPRHSPHHLHLARQVFHNLQHQHLWPAASLTLHTSLTPPNPSSAATATMLFPHSSSATTTNPSTSPIPLFRPLISGLPPTRLYVHPDEQVAHLAALRKASARGKRLATQKNTAPTAQDKRLKESKSRESRPASTDPEDLSLTAPSNPAIAPVESLHPDQDNDDEDDDSHLSTTALSASYATPEREWVLPTHISEKWTLRELARVFDGIGIEPPIPGVEPETESGAESGASEEGMGNRMEEISEEEFGERKEEISEEELGERKKGEKEGKWSGRVREKKSRKRAKRVLLAVVSDDSTVVYYWVHEGEVKPRQN